MFTLYENVGYRQHTSSTLKRYLETVNAECVGKHLNFFHRKLNEFIKQRQALAKITTVTSKLLLA
jgi:hypothetical protein